MTCHRRIAEGSDLNIFRMENRESRNLLEVALFVEGQNLGNFVILHDDAMDDVADTRMVFQNALADMVEKL